MLNVLMALALLLSACAGATEPPKVEPTKVSEATEVAEPTALPPAEITWILDGTGTPRDAEEVFAHLNSLPQVKALNVTVKPIWYDWGSYDQKTQLMFAGGEPCDLIFTASWANNYVNGAINGNYIALDDLLPKYAPKTWEAVGPVAWNMSKVQGKIYAIPNQQLWYDAWGWQMRQDIADKYGVTKETINSFEDLTPVMAKILADHPEWKHQIVQGFGPYHNGTMGYDAVNGYGWIKFGDTSRKVVNPIELPIYQERYKLWREWVLAGYAPQEAIDYANADAARKEGFFPIKLHVEKPGVSAEDAKIYGQGAWLAEPLEPPVLAYILPTMTGVCATSKNPERALMFFDLMYSDAEVYNTFAKGLEGKHWVWVDKEKKVIGIPEGVDPVDTGYAPNTDWMYGTVFISYYQDASQVGAWEETAAVNKIAVLPMAGPFVFDPTPVQAELTALQTVDTQYGAPLQQGLVDLDDPDAGIQAYIAAQKAAGLEKVLAEVQKQLDAFVAANPDIFK
jgi:putative aldouronate transport system substrate-binding protein